MGSNCLSTQKGTGQVGVEIYEECEVRLEGGKRTIILERGD